MDIASASYIGRKGYTILKSSLNEQNYKKIKTELYLKPVISGQNYGMVKVNPFPVYRENEKKYMFRFYGLKEYGIPSKIDLPEGFDINIDFVKSLRDYQENIVNIYLKHVTKDDYNKGGILEVPCGRGKTVLA